MRRDHPGPAHRRRIIVEAGLVVQPKMAKVPAAA